MSARRKAAAKPSRVVLDGALLLASLLRSDAQSMALRQAWQHGRIQPLVSPATAQSLMRALAYPAWRLTATQQHELLADFLPYAEVFKPLARPCPAALGAGAWQALALASQGQADCLVSDDLHLQAWLSRSRSPWAKAMCDVQTAGSFISGL